MGKLKTYFSVDVETAGPTPNYLMMSIGSVRVNDLRRRFYREIAPIELNPPMIPEAVRIGSLGLKCLEGKGFGARRFKKNPRQYAWEVLSELSENSEGPLTVMTEFKEWIEGNTPEGYEARLVAAPISFDAGFIGTTFSRWGVENPFGHSGEDINSMYRGVTGRLDAHVAELGIRGDGLPNALEDAIIQAKEFREVLRLMGKK